MSRTATFPQPGLYQYYRGQKYRVIGVVFDFQSTLNSGEILFHPEGKPHIFWRMSSDAWHYPANTQAGQMQRFIRIEE